MQIVALFIIVICLVAIAYRDLKTGLISLLAIGAAVAVFYVFSPSEEPGRKAAQQLNDIELSHTQISRGYADGFVLDLRIHNNSRDKILQNFTISSRLSDCNSDQSDCLIIGEEKNVVKLRIPAGQARDTKINLRTQLLNPVRGTATWNHEVVGVK
jgi:hypothetical protein